MDAETAAVSARSRVSIPFLILGLATILSIIWMVVLVLGSLNRDYLDIDVQAVDPLTGETNWAMSLSGTEVPVFGENTIVVITGRGVAGYDAAGTRRWQFDDGRSYRAMASHGVVLVDTRRSDGSAMTVALDEMTGDVLWLDHGGRAYRVGDRLAAIRDGDTLRIVDRESGELVAELSGNERDVKLAGGTAAILIGRSLRSVTVGGEVRVLARGLPNSEIVALFDGVAVIEHAADVEDRPRPRTLTAYDTGTGDLVWEETVDQYGSAIEDGRMLRLVGDNDAVEIDVLTGRQRLIEGAAAVLARLDVVDGYDKMAVYAVSRVDSASGATTYYTVGDSRGAKPRRMTIAVNSGTSDVRWTVDAASVLTAADGLVALLTANGAEVVAESSGEVLAVVAKKGKLSAVAIDDGVAIVTDGTITVVSASSVRTVSAKVDTRSRIVAVFGEILVLDYLQEAESGDLLRSMMAIDLETGEELWVQLLAPYRTAELGEGTLVLTRAKSVTEIDVVSGTATNREHRTPLEDAEPRPSQLAAFDAELTTLLWFIDDVRVSTAGVVDGTVILVEITNSLER